MLVFRERGAGIDLDGRPREDRDQLTLKVALLLHHRIAVGEHLSRRPELPAAIGVHFACHARAQNMGPKAMEMLRLIPEAKPALTERAKRDLAGWLAA